MENYSSPEPAKQQGFYRTIGVLALAASLLALPTALCSLLNERLYNDAVAAGNINRFLRSGSLAQDMVTVPLAALLAILSLMLLRKANAGMLVTVLGLLGYLFYGYGLYAMQGQYTVVYPAYLAIFGLSVYGLIYGLCGGNQYMQVQLSRPLRKVIGVFLMAIPATLTPVWISMMLPALRTHHPADTYGVFVLDLAIVFPALAITAIMLFRGRSSGHALAGVALFKVFTVCLSVAFGEWYSAGARSVPINAVALTLFSTLTFIGGVLFIIYLKGLKSSFPLA